MERCIRIFLASRQLAAFQLIVAKMPDDRYAGSSARADSLMDAVISSVRWGTKMSTRRRSWQRAAYNWLTADREIARNNQNRASIEYSMGAVLWETQLHVNAL
jgi:hypothetical protein